MALFPQLYLKENVCTVHQILFLCPKKTLRKNENSCFLKTFWKKKENCDNFLERKFSVAAVCILGRIFNKDRKFHTRSLNTAAMLWDINHLIFGIFWRNDDTRNTSWIQLVCVSIRNQIKVRLGSYRGWSSCCCWGCGWGCGGDINWFVDEDWDYIRHGTLIRSLKITKSGVNEDRRTEEAKHFKYFFCLPHPCLKY